MPSKTFKSSRPTGTMLRVDSTEVFSEAHLTIVLYSREEDICIAPSDAPALALAILEAAGYVANSADAGVQPGESCDDHFWDAAEILRDGIAIQTEATAKDKAELEAEALELHQLFESLQSDDETIWLAVARRARELNKEATNGR